MEAILPAGLADARLANAAIMELGAVVCTARAPRCDACPIAAQCSWRLDGYPPYLGKKATVQKKYEGSDRQVRGLILAEIRAAEVPVSGEEIDAVWPDATQRRRAMASLLRDGLVNEGDGGYELP
jgi:A/G-specific adenine glycosylase